MELYKWKIYLNAKYSLPPTFSQFQNKRKKKIISCQVIHFAYYFSAPVNSTGTAPETLSFNYKLTINKLHKRRLFWETVSVIGQIVVFSPQYIFFFCPRNSFRPVYLTILSRIYIFQCIDDECLLLWLFYRCASLRYKTDHFLTTALITMQPCGGDNR